MSNRSNTAHSIASAARAKADHPPPYDAEAFNHKLPLLRSDAAVNDAALELLKLFGHKAKQVYSVCGVSQEFFLVDRGWHNKRTDLMLTGRTLVGAPPPRERRLDGTCVGSINERMLNYVHDVRAEVQVGTCHGGAAPNQYGFAPVFERYNLAVDHNLLLMDIMKKVALRHNLVCLLHEKPFAGVNGSGKRVNWSLSDDKGGNLLNPGDTTEENLIFLTLLLSVVRAAHLHGDLLCAAAASAGNEWRLGADEAPPAVMSVSLGKRITKTLAAIEAGKPEKGKKRDLADLAAAAADPADAADRNSASPFAFTGATFEFRMPGGSMNAATAVTVINAIVADSMRAICERIKKELKGKGGKRAAADAEEGASKDAAESAETAEGAGEADADARRKEVNAAAMSVLAAVIKEAKPVLFEGDNYSSEWAEEARARGLRGAAPVHEAVKAFAAPKAVELFGRHKIFSEAELAARRDAALGQYVDALDTEIKTLTEIVNTQVLPAAYNYQADIASGLEVLRVLADDMTIEMADGALEDRKEMFEKLTADIYRVRKNLKELSAVAGKARGMAAGERAAYLFKEAKPQMDRVRQYVDALESCMSDEAWPLPKYKEMLFVL